MANKRLVAEPVEVPEVDETATPMERLTAFARRIVQVPKAEIDERPDRDSLEGTPTRD